MRWITSRTATPSLTLAGSKILRMGTWMRFTSCATCTPQTSYTCWSAGSFNVGGVAYVLCDQRDDGTFSDSAFGLTVGHDNAGLIFAHELGHNMGLKHDRYQVLKNEERTDSIDGYNFGYVNQRMFQPEAPESARWRTIMSYDRQCEDYRKENDLEDFYCQSILRFSNPDLDLQRRPAGRSGQPARPEARTGLPTPREPSTRTGRWWRIFAKARLPRPK